MKKIKIFLAVCFAAVLLVHGFSAYGAVDGSNENAETAAESFADSDEITETVSEDSDSLVSDETTETKAFSEKLADADERTETVSESLSDVDENPETLSESISDSSENAETVLESVSDLGESPETVIESSSNSNEIAEMVPESVADTTESIDQISEAPSEAEQTKNTGSSAEEPISVPDLVDISTVKISLEYKSAVYDGTRKTPAVAAWAGSSELIPNVDFQASYSNNKNAGTAAVIIKGLGSYSGKVTLNFTIKKAPQRPSISLTKSRAAVKSTLKVKAKGKGEVSYTSSDTSVAVISKDGVVTAKKPGIVSIKASFSGNENYKAKSKSVKLSVVPAKTRITGIANTSKGLKINWKKSAGAAGYYIYRSVKGTRYTLLKTLKSTDSLKFTDTTVLSGKKYYYKILPFSGKQKGDASAVKSCYRLDQPVIKSLANPKAGSVTVSWKKVKNADGYAVISLVGGKQKIYWIKDPAVTSKTIKGIGNASVCKFRIRAWKENEGKRSYSLKSASRKITARENYIKITGSGSTRTISLINPTDPKQSFKAAVWSKSNGQDDLVWYTLQKNNSGKWTAAASASVIAHPGKCLVHCYDGDETFVGSGSFELTAQEQAAAVNPKVSLYARNLLDRVGWSLSAAYNWSTGLVYQSMVVPMTVPVTGSYAGFNRQELYFIYAYENGKGNCFCYAASFYWMARELGYNARLIEGQVLLPSGNYGPHSWVEIDMNGGTYIFDPESQYELGKDGYMKTYETGPSLAYRKVRPY